MKHALRVAAVLLVALLSAERLSAQSGLERLQAFTVSLRSLSADFVQTLYDANGRQVRESGGTLRLLRPGRFRWDYDHPYRQQIVADGQRLWIYDHELEQVTVRSQKGALGQAPIMLLSEGRAIELDFQTRDLGRREGLDWVELKPFVQDTDFRVIYLGFDGNGIKVMELRDHFEQVTQIRFGTVKHNSTIEPDVFRFTPPAGVDVIGEAVAGED